MNCLLAKVRASHENYKKVLSLQGEMFDLPDLSALSDYSPAYKLEEDEWYTLKKFTSLGFDNPIISTKWNSTNYNQINRDEYSKIIYLCCRQDRYFLFQKMSSTQLLLKKWFYVSGEPQLEIEKPIVVINDYIDAIYNIDSDILYFKNISRIKPMFKGIEQLYREATQNEVDSFLRQNFLTLANGYTSESVKTANRKRIAMAIDSLDQLKPQDKAKIFRYIQGYCTDVSVKGNSFVIETEDHLKKVLYGIEQRYYTTPIGGEKRLANSISRI